VRRPDGGQAQARVATSIVRSSQSSWNRAAELVLFRRARATGGPETPSRQGLRAEVLSGPGSGRPGEVAVRRLGELTGRRTAAGASARPPRGRRGRRGVPLASVPRSAARGSTWRVDGPRKLYAVGPAPSWRHRPSRRRVETPLPGPAAYFPVAPEEDDPAIRVISWTIPSSTRWVSPSGLGGRRWLREAGRVYDATDFDIILLNRPGPRVGRRCAGGAAVAPEIFGVPTEGP